MASARVVKPAIKHFAASPSKVTNSDGTVTVSATVTNASSCTLSSSLPLINLPVTVDCSSGSLGETVIVPENAGRKAQSYTLTLTASGEVTKSKKVKVTVDAGDGRPALSGVKNVVATGYSGVQTYCALLTSGGVDCWGSDDAGALGNGLTSGPGSTPVAVVGVGDTGTLTGVKSLVSDQTYPSFCAVLESGGVDCWGDNTYGELGDGTESGSDSCQAASVCSPSPVAVVGAGGVGTLSDVTTMVGGYSNYCAALTTGGAVCWGYAGSGNLGGGNGDDFTVDVPEPVEVSVGVPLTDMVANLVSSITDGEDICAVLTSGGVDCWGANGAIVGSGNVGNGLASGPDECWGATAPNCEMYATPVVGVGDTGTLSGVTSVVGPSANGFCAVLSSGGVDCWGADPILGNGSSGGDSPSPVPVDGVGGVGALTSVAGLVTDEGIGSGGDAPSICAILVSGGVDCWGGDSNDDLGDGSSYGSTVPVSVLGVNGTGTLSGVTSMDSDQTGFCAVASGGVDCWGSDTFGALGAGSPSCLTAGGDCATPAQVVGVNGTSGISGVTSLAAAYFDSNCAVLTSGGVDCWGDSDSGELGDGSTTATDSPVPVFAPA